MTKYRLKWPEIDGDAGFGIILAIQILVIFVVAPLAAIGAVSAELVEGLRFGLAATTILIVAQRTLVRWLVALTFAATLIASMRWHLGHPAAAIGIFRALTTISFDLVVAGIVAVAAFRPGKVTVHRILGAVILYLYIALIFAGLYRFLSPILTPGFSGMAPDPRAQYSGLLYFSIGAMTTSSSGDIVALHPVLRSMASLESVMGQLFPATLLARLVALQAAHGARED
jgi:hypothetical protein